MGKQVKQLLRQELGEKVSITFNAYKGKNSKESKAPLKCWISSGRKGLSITLEELEDMTNELVANFDIIVAGFKEAEELQDEGYEIAFGEASIESSDPEPQSVQSRATKVVSINATTAVAPAKTRTKAKPAKPKAEPEQPTESPQVRLASLQQARASLHA
jgi:hypothetical protein